MNYVLKTQLNEYKNCTVKIIEILEKEDFESIDNVIKDRDLIIKSIKEINYTKEEFTSIGIELQLMRLEKKLNEIINEKRADIKNKIDKMYIAKNANKNYNKNMYSSAVIFSKKI